MFDLLYALPSTLLHHSEMQAIWGKELPHLIKEVYGISLHEIPLHSQKLSFGKWLHLLYASWQYRKGIPYEYIWGHTSFRGRDFLVNHSVLIPRPETEEWVGRVVEDIQKKKTTTKSMMRILDIGTGSGAIAITLAIEIPSVQVTALEVSPPALRLAQKNANRISSSGNLRFIGGDIFRISLGKLLPQQRLFDIVVSNPPYVGWGDKSSLAPSVVHEPEVALFAGEDGLDFYRKLTDLLPRILRPQGRLYLEIGWKQGQTVRDLFGFMKRGRVMKDMFGKERLFVGTL